MTIRHARDSDWPRIGELGELLVRAHHEYDRARFIPPEKLAGEVYTSRVREELAANRGAIFVADVDGQVVGYVFAGIEPDSWKELRHEAGYIHDLVVDRAIRRSGVGRALLFRAIEWCRSRGVSRIMLWTAVQNSGAQELFARAGFRTTMMEMTLDAPAPDAATATPA